MTTVLMPVKSEIASTGDWEQQRLKYLVRFVGGATPSTDDPTFWNGEIPWVSPKDMKVANISDAEDHLSEIGLASCSSQRVASGNVLVVVRSGILRHTLPVAINVRDVALNQDMKALIPRGSLVAAFLRYVLMANQPAALDLIRKQGATVESIDQALLSNMIISFPNVDQQVSIASFLDIETAEADALVTKYERLIELLEEKRVAIITQAVTKGLNPNIPMKDTGVQIIGDVPEHWAVLPLRRLASVRGGTGIPEDYLTDDESAIPFFKVGDIESADSDGVMRNARSFVISSVPESAAGTWFPKDTIVLAKRGAALLLNRFRQTGQNGFFDSNLMGLKVDHKKLNLRFALHVLSIVDLVQYVKPGAIPSIDAPEIKNQVIALPPVQEQTLIVNHIEVWTRNIAIEISLVQRAVALVKEHRSALITAAVTGQIDIRTYRSKKQPVGVSA